MDFHEPIQDQRRLYLEEVLTYVFELQHVRDLFDLLAHRVDMNAASGRRMSVPAARPASLPAILLEALAT